MRYNQPYGVVDTNAPYINGNPATGVQGSIPPNTAFEHDQREIVAVIQYAYDQGLIDLYGNICAAPSSGDLTQLLKAIMGMIKKQQPIQSLTAPISFYVNQATGSDTLYDGRSATVSGTTGPYATIQKALLKINDFNLSNFDFNIFVADGTYSIASALRPPIPNGSGHVNITGNASTPGNCIISSAAGSCLVLGNGGNYTLNGFRLNAGGSTSPSDPGDGVWCQMGTLNLKNIVFGVCNRFNVTASSGLVTYGSGTIAMAGSCYGHIWSQAGGNTQIINPPNSVDLTILTPITVSQAFVQAGANGVAKVQFNSINGAGNVTGKKYFANTNGVIDSAGGGVNYLPGTVAGTTDTGGQYV